jgi:malate permease and related proteins
MANYLLMVGCFIAGILLRYCNRIREEGSAAINSVLLFVTIPAVIIMSLHRIELHWDLIYPLAMPLLVFFIGLIFSLLLGKLFAWPNEIFGSVAICVGIANVGLIGIPMTYTFYGHSGLDVAVICLNGLILALVFGAVPLANLLRSKGVYDLKLFLNFLMDPLVIAMILGLASRPLPFPPLINHILRSIGATFTPLALISIGSVFSLSALQKYKSPLFFSLLIKMVVIPLAVFLLYRIILDKTGMTIDVAIFESAMPPALIGVIVIMEYKLEAEIAILIMGAGTLLAFITCPALWWLLRIF